jgi:uncharacterized membrane protein HdeD (DUF308 family)
MTYGSAGTKPGTARERPTVLAWGGSWQALLVVAVAMFVLGLILLVWPHASVTVVAVLIGIALLADGILLLVRGLMPGADGGGRRVGYVVIGILAGLAGLYCLRHLNVTVSILGFIVGVFWVMHGVVDLALAAGARGGTGRWLAGVVGVLSMLFGLLAIFWPSETLTVLVAIMGIWLILYGVLLAAAAFVLRRTPQDPMNPLSPTAPA